jgi:enoyl-CoA hydratase/carnithine racemase
LGIVYPDFALQRAVEVLGPDVTRVLLLTGELVDADRALRVGLAHEVHEAGAAEQRLAELVTTMAGERSLLSQWSAKEMVASIVDTGAIAPELVDRWAAEMATAPDRDEGISAFLDRRPPRFTWPGPRS